MKKRALAISIVLLCLPAELVGGLSLISFFDRVTASGIVTGINQFVPAQSSGPLVFLALVDFNIVHSYGVLACLVALVLWFFLLVLEEGLTAKLLTLGCLLFAVIGTLVTKPWSH